eukprot:gnl/MRDRNA2_/MRDRNA2_115850_c0_seq1.p1 gnl/MRDRNA2_/MRDRNA2_115850_c0~~gnl/MRDRNA2_/MRDRNA2_115850_c0_seq1.p1  ORF type:complete len:310 (+),score=41.43 gnl/MRDRNA2_/MRDRNA2_115850_c0_seq1:126-1055(+)
MDIYRYKSTLEFHKRTKHSKNGGRNFPCDVSNCTYVGNKAFVLHSQLKHHKRIRHSENRGRDFPCNFPDCPHVSTQQGMLNIHKRIKHAENSGRDFPCTVLGCSRIDDKAFKYKKLLVKHQRLEHPDSKVFQSKDPTLRRRQQTQRTMTTLQTTTTKMLTAKLLHSARKGTALPRITTMGMIMVPDVANKELSASRLNDPTHTTMTTSTTTDIDIWWADGWIDWNDVQWDILTFTTTTTSTTEWWWADGWMDWNDVQWAPYHESFQLQYLEDEAPSAAANGGAETENSAADSKRDFRRDLHFMLKRSSR